jgi:parvulin-like peptidyl-prolyl isomerase
MNTATPLVLLSIALLGGCEETPAPQVAQSANPLPARGAVPVAEPEPEPNAAAEEKKPPDAVAAQHVLITYRGAKNAPKEVTRSKAAAKKLAEDIAKQAKGGADFTGLVKEHSEDPGTKDRLGSVGKFTPDKMVKPFSEAAFALDVDEVSDAVESEFGFHIIKRNQ